MHKKLYISKSILILSLGLGAGVLYLLQVSLHFASSWVAGGSVAAFILCYLLLGWSCSAINKWRNAFNQLLDNTSIEIILGGASGLLLGIIVAVLSSFPLSMIRGMGSILVMIVFLVSVILGLKIGIRRAADILNVLPVTRIDKYNGETMRAEQYKVLDTSAIIDGRIYDVCISKFLEGPLIVPTFVIEELQHIADSSDNIRRNKGRRGLELLSKMQKHSDIKIDIIEANISTEKDVDGKLICLCKQMNASIITNDYNLNKVAELQGIKVLNINELTNAVKMIVYPGENMHICIIKEGKESRQGVGYLEDGTMVVVEDASDEIGNDLDVVVTSVFQTAAGRMIFTRKIKENQPEQDLGMAHSLRDMAEVNVYG